MTIPLQSEIDLILEAISEYPPITFDIDTTGMPEALEFIAEVRAMERFGCTVTVDGAIVRIVGPGPLVGAIREAIAETTRRALELVGDDA